MKTKFALGAVVAAIAVFSQTAFAQPASAPVTREQRKAETAEANKAGKLTPAGEGNIGADAVEASDKTRDRAQGADPGRHQVRQARARPAKRAVQKADKADATSRARPPATRARRRPKPTARLASWRRLATARPRSKTFFLTAAAVVK